MSQDVSREPKTGEEERMLWRVFGSSMALLGFAVVCLRGLLQGEPVGPVLVQSLLAMAVGGVVGLLAAVVVRYVVREQFDKPAAPGGAAGGEKPSVGAAAGQRADKEKAEARAGGASRANVGKA